MLKRKITEKMADWKRRENRNSLLVKGARQVGKTYSIAQFCKENYTHCVTLNFDQDPSYRAIFDDALDADTLVKQITLRVPHARLVPGKTVLFLDEIQNCPRARTALKFLAMDRRFDVIASGSMLGIHYKEVPSYPVGYEDILEMHSLDFEEFLWANGIPETSIADIYAYFEAKQPLPEAMHTRLLELFREYIVTGGMPRVVQQFVDHHDFAEVLRTQKAILSDYLDDIAKYADGAEKAKARACFLSIPRHLSQDYKKFRYSLVSQGGSARKYGGSLQWLFDAGIISFCHNLATPELPLEGNARSDAFKVYMRDTGLLVAMLDEGTQADIIDGNLGIYKGAIYENIVAEMLTKLGRKLYYFERNASLEVDFILRWKRRLTAVEVKSSDNTKSKSLQTLLTQYGVPQGIRLSSKNVGTRGNVDFLPLYMAMFLTPDRV